MTNNPPSCPHCKCAMILRSITGSITDIIETWNCYKCAEYHKDGRQKRWEIVILPWFPDKNKPK